MEAAQTCKFEPKATSPSPRGRAMAISYERVKTPTDIGNVALSLGNHTPSEPGDLAAVVAGDIAPNGPPSYFNLALNLGNGKNIQAKGFGNSVLNIFGDGITLNANGVVNNATNVFGDNNELIAANVPDPTANILRQIGGNVAFTGFGNGNIVQAGSQTAPPGGPLSIAGTLGVDDRSIIQPATGISIATPFNSTGSNTNVLATRSTQGGPLRPGVKAAISRPTTAEGRPLQASLNTAHNRDKASSAGRSVLKSVSDRITTSAKKRSDTVKKATDGRARDAKAGAPSTPSSHKGTPSGKD